MCVSVLKGGAICRYMIWASTRETCLRRLANNTGADQPAHPRSLISAFIIRVLESTISKLATTVAEQTGFSLALSETPKTGFVATRPICDCGITSARLLQYTAVDSCSKNSWWYTVCPVTILVCQEGDPNDMTWVRYLTAN